MSLSGCLVIEAISLEGVPHEREQEFERNIAGAELKTDKCRIQIPPTSLPCFKIDGQGREIQFSCIKKIKDVGSANIDGLVVDRHVAFIKRHPEIERRGHDLFIGGDYFGGIIQIAGASAASAFPIVAQVNATDPNTRLILIMASPI